MGRPGPTAWHRLNPLTKLTVLLATTLAAFALGGVVAPVVLLVVAVLVPAGVAGLLRPVARAAVLLSLPLAVSAALVNLLFTPGGATVLVQLGPLTVTAEGAGVAVTTVLRILVVAGAAALFFQATRLPALVADLERRGVSPRLTFVAASAVGAVPAMLERARMITAAQRARGLDTEGSTMRRLRGLVPIVAPTILGSIDEAEERSMALEARGFTRPGRRTPLWTPPDAPAQRAARWLLVAAAVIAVVLPVLGVRLP
ncbi:MAG: energy-coupling factor transporter transmembrane component T [Chloroflexota bacterium]